MMETPHLGFIVAAYAVATATIVAMIAAILLDHRALRADLRALEAPGGDSATGAEP